MTIGELLLLGVVILILLALAWVIDNIIDIKKKWASGKWVEVEERLLKVELKVDRLKFDIGFPPTKLSNNIEIESTIKRELKKTQKDLRHLEGIVDKLIDQDDMKVVKHTDYYMTPYGKQPFFKYTVEPKSAKDKEIERLSKRIALLKEEETEEEK